MQASVPAMISATAALLISCRTSGLVMLLAVVVYSLALLVSIVECRKIAPKCMGRGIKLRTARATVV